MSDDLGAALRREVGLYTEEDLMALLQCTKATLQEWRSRGLGPAFCKLGKTVMYRRIDVEEWVNANVFSNTSLARAA